MKPLICATAQLQFGVRQVAWKRDESPVRTLVLAASTECPWQREITNSVPPARRTKFISSFDEEKKFRFSLKISVSANLRAVEILQAEQIPTYRVVCW